jgi:hypothetical protein
MRRFLVVLAVTAAGYAALAALAPTAAHAQVMSVQIVRPYTPVVVAPSYLPPVYVNPPGVVYSSPIIAPSYPSTLSVYPATTTVYSYYAAPVYAAPAVVPASGVYSTYTYHGYGIFRPRGTYTQTYYTPIYP